LSLSRIRRRLGQAGAEAAVVGGTTEISLTRAALMARLAARVTPPRRHDRL